MTRIILFLLGLFLTFSCQKSNDYIQDVLVNVNINLSLPEYSNLQAVGNYMFINNEGVKGIIIYHQYFDAYKTYDRSCTYQSSLNCAKIDSINSSIAICNCCNSKFLLNQNGETIDGPALLSLKQYQNTLSGDLLHIYN